VRTSQSFYLCSSSLVLLGISSPDLSSLFPLDDLGPLDRRAVFAAPSERSTPLLTSFPSWTEREGKDQASTGDVHIQQLDANSDALVLLS
jgi:hypothetical protein